MLRESLQNVRALRLCLESVQTMNPVMICTQAYKEYSVLFVLIPFYRFCNSTVNKGRKRFSGAFEGIDKIISNRLTPAKTIGFGRDIDPPQTAPAERIQQVTKDDLVAYGLLPELLGRIGTLLTIPPLSLEDYRQLLLGDKGSIQYQYQNYLKGLYGVSFSQIGKQVMGNICEKSEE